MLDFTGQASGLQRWRREAPTRLVAVAALPHNTAGLQLLWLLTRQQATAGTPLLVLDGQATERGQGLSARLHGATTDPGPVLPAREGLLALCERARRDGPESARRELLDALPPGSLVLLSAPPEVLSMLLMGTGVHPLVALVSGPRAVVAAYNALKVLLHAGELAPVLVPLEMAQRQAELRRAAQAVQRCCREHLGEAVQSWPVAYHDDHAAEPSAVPESWWLRVLDSALTQDVGVPFAPGAMRPRTGSPSAAFRSS